MKIALIAATLLFALLLALAQQSTAQTCHEKFVDLVVYGYGDKPLTIHVEKKSPNSKNGQSQILYLSPTNYLMIDNALPNLWMLRSGNTLHESKDEGKSWKKIPWIKKSQDYKSRLKAAKQEASKNTHNAACKEEKYNGVLHDTIEADLSFDPSWDKGAHSKYWISRDTKDIVKQTVLINSTGQLTTFIMESTQDITLPTPKY